MCALLRYVSVVEVLMGVFFAEVGCVFETVFRVFHLLLLYFLLLVGKVLVVQVVACRIAVFRLYLPDVEYIRLLNVQVD